MGLAVALAAALDAAPRALAATPEALAAAPQPSAESDRCANHDPLRQPFFGDLHVHTVLSLDASTMDTRNRPADAYRFARGEAIGIQPYAEDGRALRTMQLERPLDFAAVTDHAELLGEVETCTTPGMPGHDSLVCGLYRNWPRGAFFWMNFQASRGVRHDFCGEGGEHCLEAARGPWREIREAAADANEGAPGCGFTAFTGYEWTGAAGAGNNLHRNVIFAGDAVPDLPISFIDDTDVQGFWGRLDAECRGAGTGCDVLVIPHNTNLSGGLMFRTVDEDGEPIGLAEAELRRRFEPLVEMMQHKGDSECMTGLGNADEQCGFEKLAQRSFGGRFAPFLAEPPLARQFVRNLLREGLEEERRLGTNPFRLGFIASTDTHLGTAGAVAESADYPGHGGAGKPPGETKAATLPDHLDFNPGGLAVLWAEENSRAALFAAMRRREAYGTSGPRIVVRFFGGWAFEPGLCGRSDLPARGYARGVPMGGVLPPRPDAAGPPTFAISALADAGTATAPGQPLERVQIVKGWLGADASHERVYDVAGDASGQATVDTATCRTAGPGAGALCTVWRDPDFDPDAPAFYYGRVLENPSCRWSQKLCVKSGVRCDDPSTVPEGLAPCCSAEHRPVIRERAWTSPIWYDPNAR